MILWLNGLPKEVGWAWTITVTLTIIAIVIQIISIVLANLVNASSVI
jgi:hypothetical protein